MVLKTRIQFLVLTTMLLLLIGCNSKPIDSGSETTEVPSIAPSQMTETSSMPTVWSTATFVPTLTFVEAEQSLWDLIGNNGDCRFPCIWGMTPGLTSKNSLFTFANSYGKYREAKNEIIFVDYYEDPGVGGIGLISFTDNVRTRVDYSYMLDENLINLLSLSFSQDSIIGEGIDREYIELFGGESYNQKFSKYLIPQILTEYGLPSQILISFADEALWYKSVYWMPFNLVLYYPEQGFIVEYTSALEQEGDQITGCPFKSHIGVFTWDKEKGPSEEEYSGKDGKYWGLDTESLYSYKPIEEVTDYSIDSFYKEFLNPENNICIETSLRDWIGN